MLQYSHFRALIKGAAVALLGTTLGLMVSTGASAQELADRLRVLLTNAQNGQCGPGLAPLTAEACKQQLPYLQGRLTSLGAIVSVSFVGQQVNPATNKPVPVYKVQFQRGEMLWLLNTDSLNQIDVLWTPG